MIAVRRSATAKCIGLFLQGAKPPSSWQLGKRWQPCSAESPATAGSTLTDAYPIRHPERSEFERKRKRTESKDLAKNERNLEGTNLPTATQLTRLYLQAKKLILEILRLHVSSLSLRNVSLRMTERGGCHLGAPPQGTRKRHLAGNPSMDGSHLLPNPQVNPPVRVKGQPPLGSQFRRLPATRAKRRNMAAIV